MKRSSRSTESAHPLRESRSVPDSRRLPDPMEQPTITVERAAAVFGISRGAAYEAVRNGSIPSLRIGRRLVVPTARVAALLCVPAVDAKADVSTILDERVKGPRRDPPEGSKPPS